ncbi:MAG: HDOD domain-containing protein [Pirellulales bacterium]|nr:HDOD domain-containing protein [Pirellulales bacterium]
MSQATPTPPRSIDHLIADGGLPALPQSAIQILSLSQNPANGPAEYALPIEADAGLASQVLRFVNSSYFGFSREIASVKLAISLVGVRTMKNFVLWSAVFSLMPNPKCGPFDLKLLWQDSFRRGLLARAVARLLKCEQPEECFAAGLLQDMAIPLLAREFPAEYAGLLNSRQGGQLRLSALERENFGWTHAEVAGRIAQRWNLPESLTNLLRQHLSLDALLAQPEAPRGAAAVALSALLPPAIDEQWHEWPAFEIGYRRLCPTGPSAAALLAQVDAEFAEFAPILKLPMPAQTLAQRIASVSPTPATVA